MKYNVVRTYVNQYCQLRDVQYAAYELYARKHNLTAKELFVLDILWFAPDGCLQTDICERLSVTKQTVSAIIKKLLKKGYVTSEGIEYTKHIIPPAANAEIDAMAELSENNIAELVRLTTLFSHCMKKKFDEIQVVQK